MVMHRAIKFYRQAPGEPGGGSPPATPPTGPPAPVLPPAPVSPPPATPPVEEKKLDLTQAQVDKLIEDRLNQERRTNAQKAEDEKAAAATKKAKEDGELQTVVTAHEATISDLKPKAELATTLATRMNESIDTEVKEWPEEVTKLDPGKDDVLARIKWLDNSRSLAVRLKTLGAPPNLQFGLRGSGGGNGQGATTVLQQVGAQLDKKYQGPPGQKKQE